MPDITPEATLLADLRWRLASALRCLPGELPADLAGMWDLIGPALADHAHVRHAYIIGMSFRGLPVANADGPLSVRQMMESLAASDNRAVADLAEIRTRLAAAGYVPTQGEALGDVVARSIKDTREADDKRDELEQAVERLTAERDAARSSADDIARVLVKANELSTFTATVLREHTANNR